MNIRTFYLFNFSCTTLSDGTDQHSHCNADQWQLNTGIYVRIKLALSWIQHKKVVELELLKLFCSHNNLQFKSNLLEEGCNFHYYDCSTHLTFLDNENSQEILFFCSKFQTGINQQSWDLATWIHSAVIGTGGVTHFSPRTCWKLLGEVNRGAEFLNHFQL